MHIFKRNKDEIELFWKWFLKNSDKYFYFENNQYELFKQLKMQLNSIDSNLVFEFSPILNDGKREFVISADGIKSSFPSVIRVVKSAPLLSNWKIIAFRQPRREISQVNYDNLVIKYEDVYFRFAKDNDQVALELNIRGFYESPEWTGAVFILLDSILGEYHAEMSLSAIKKQILNESEIPTLFPIISLPQVIQDYLSELNN